MSQSIPRKHFFQSLEALRGILFTQADSPFLMLEMYKMEANLIQLSQTIQTIPRLFLLRETNVWKLMKGGGNLEDEASVS